ncbi:MAG: acyltransferase domain-containing protein, partial [Oscillospiraceae bacterium]|nr:acyltransferase domain-containing protein [Oscillospiraceae bacterium]
MLESMKEKKIAIVGIGCRFPGGSNSAEEFWRLLDSGTDAIRETPGDRWSSKAFYNRKRSFKGKTVSKWGGFIDNVDKFDAAFFGISNREAPYMDPQQRLLLETTWEAFEDGGLVVEKFSGTKVGVYIGGFTLDYKILQFGGFDYDSIDIHTASGSMMTNLSNRISHVFDFKGPSISIDTACSSSLVALHLASQGIKNGDCDAAVVGGVMLNLAPQYTIAESQGGFLSEDGRCKTLDAAANGYVRGEGVGIVILKKLEDAVRDNDYIYSVVEAAGANQDGHTSAITVPSADAQERLMREVHKRAGVKSSDIQYVEMHGTGTSVGDPIEAEALGKVFSEGRSAENPCFIGSVKTMIGHLESAAGVASIIKVSMSLDKKKIPRHLNMREINPKIDLETYKLKVPQKTIDWPDHKGEALACINGFGFGGTNGHIVLSGVSARRAFANGSLDGRMKVFAISARSQESLKMQAEKYIRFLDQNYFTGKSYDLARNMMLRRDQHNFRLAVAEKDAPGLMRALQSYIDGDDCSVVYTGKKKDRAEKGLVFVFTGMGAQYWNMGRGLYACEPVFKEEVDRIDVAFSRYSGWSLVEKMMSCREDDSEMAETCVSQPANFAIQVGIYKLLEAKGVAPEVIVGHSVGEVAAFYCSGIFTFEDAIKVIYYRSMLQHTLAGQGKMLAVSISKEQASGMLAEYPGVEIAAINSMNDLTLTGDETGLKGISEKLTDEGVFNRFLTVSVPFHSRHMEKIQDAFRVGISGIKFNTPKVRFFSTVLGVELEADSLLLGAAPGADNAVFGEAPAVDSAAPVAVCSAPGADSPEAGAALVADCQVFEATPGADSPEAGAALVADCQVFEATPGADCPVEYWWENIRNPVQFSPAVEKIIVEGYNAFIEVGPHPVLSYYIKSLGENSGTKISTVATMNRKQEDETCFYSALCRLFTENYFSDYEKLYPVESNFIKLPGYAWKHESFWMESAESRNHRLGVVDAHLLGRRLKAAKPTWELELSLEAFPFLEGHKIQGEQVFPAAGCIEAAFQAAKNYWGTEFVVMEDVEFTMLVFMKQDKSVRLHITLDEDNRSFEIFNMPDGIGQSDLVAKGRFRLAQNTGAWLQGGPQSRLQGGIQGRLQSRPQGG